MADFEWTDDSVQMFAHIYTSAPKSSLIDFEFDVKDYKGKPIGQKLVQFKKDYQRSALTRHYRNVLKSVSAENLKLIKENEKLSEEVELLKKQMHLREKS